MTLSQVCVKVVDQETGEVVQTLGPYASAAAARTAGEVLVWTRHDMDWVAERVGTEYRVPADPVLDA